MIGYSERNRHSETIIDFQTNHQPRDPAHVHLTGTLRVQEILMWALG